MKTFPIAAVSSTIFIALLCIVTFPFFEAPDPAEKPPPTAPSPVPAPQHSAPICQDQEITRVGTPCTRVGELKFHMRGGYLVCLADDDDAAPSFVAMCEIGYYCGKEAPEITPSCVDPKGATLRCCRNILMPPLWASRYCPNTALPELPHRGHVDDL